MIKIGILGCGNMGGAIMRGWAQKPVLAEQISILAYDRLPEACVFEGVEAVKSAQELASRSDWLLLALKPQYLPGAMAELKGALAGKLLISVAAGLSIERLKELSSPDCPVVRVMPNTPALVGMGNFALCFDDPAVSAAQADLIERLFKAIGTTLILPENRFNAFTALSGGGPAYIFYLLDALVESGVTLGFTRQEANEMVLSLAKGSLALAEESGAPLTALREQVCSPGGTTIEATNHFDRTAVRANIVDAVLRACDKGGRLG